MCSSYRLWPTRLARVFVTPGLAASFLAMGTVVPAAAADGTGIREVTASTRSMIPLQTRLRYTSMIVLPDDEDVLDVLCGDKDNWVISATHNIVHVKPAKQGASTNLNLVTGSGAVYSFLLTERGGEGMPDLKVYVTPDPDEARSKPKYYTAGQVESLQSSLAEARSAAESERHRATEAIATFQQEYPSTLQFVYGTAKYEKPFFVRAIWHDGRFTYLKTDATELPALYEFKDGAPALVNFQVHNGTYVVPKVIDRGYLAVGKSQFAFAARER